MRNGGPKRCLFPEKTCLPLQLARLAWARYERMDLLVEDHIALLKEMREEGRYSSKSLKASSAS